LTLDDRCHYFVVMVETTKMFHINARSTLDLAVIEKKMQQMAFTDFGVVIDAVYWKANENINVFKRITDVPELPKPPYAPRPTATAPNQPSGFAHTIPTFAHTTPMVDVAPSAKQHPRYEPPTEEEAQAFRAAIASALPTPTAPRRTPPLRVGDKEYSTDLAPLGPM
jgi:hypothetical protein